MSSSICFIGAGNMASSLIGGMIANGQAPESITACDVNADQLDALQRELGIQVSQDNLTAAKAADVVMLAVKPQVMQLVCEGLAGLPDNPAQMFVSVAAGVPGTAIDSWLGGGRAIVRCMPNTPALVQLGASGLSANARVSDAQRASADWPLSQFSLCSVAHPRSSA